MQPFHEWFIEIINKDTLHNYLKGIKFKAPGFRDLSKMPHQMLLNEIKKQHRMQPEPTKNLVQIIALSTDVDVNDEAFHDFIERISGNCELQPFQIIALVKQYYPEEFEEKQALFIQNVTQGIDVLTGISDYTTTTTEKLLSIITSLKEEKKDEKEILKSHHAVLLEINYEVIGHPELTITSKRYKEINEKVTDREESILRAIQELNLRSDERYLAFLAFLMKENQLDNASYESYLAFVKEEILVKESLAFLENDKYHAAKLKELEETNEKVMTQRTQIQRENDKLKVEVSELTLLNQDLCIQVDEQRKIVEAYKRKVQRYSFCILTKEEDKQGYDSGIFLDKVFSLQEFKKLPKGSSLFKTHIFFVNRTLFATTKEWMLMKKSFEQQEIQYCEIFGYSIEEHLEQIIGYFHESEGVDEA